ncbi:MAG: hypothetical protein FJ035_01740 [Chloroflexi bacterium]|nr:hypothetical protein [Chloroflexota bacterium]
MPGARVRVWRRLDAPEGAAATPAPSAEVLAALCAGVEASMASRLAVIAGPAGVDLVPYASDDAG